MGTNEKRGTMTNTLACYTVVVITVVKNGKVWCMYKCFMAQVLKIFLSLYNVVNFPFLLTIFFPLNKSFFRGLCYKTFYSCNLIPSCMMKNRVFKYGEYVVLFSYWQWQTLQLTIGSDRNILAQFCAPSFVELLCSRFC
jgi:hypothetical protein